MHPEKVLVVKCIKSYCVLEEVPVVYVKFLGELEVCKFLKMTNFKSSWVIEKVLAVKNLSKALKITSA